MDGPKNMYPFKNIYTCFYLCVYICVHVSICYSFTDVYRGQKKVQNALELEFQVVVSHLIWVLGIKLCSSPTPNRVSCNPGGPQALQVDKDDLELLILLPSPPKPKFSVGTSTPALCGPAD